MVVRRDAGEFFVLGHGVGDGATSWVERFDPQSLAVITPYAAQVRLIREPSDAPFI